MTRTLGRHALFALLVFGFVAGRAAAQTPARSCAPTRLVELKQIKVDGWLQEDAWRNAAELGRLTQVEPLEGAAPSKSTRVRMCYDRDFLFVAIECFEDPMRVRARLMERDARLDPDDRVELWVDTFHDFRTAYWFQIGAGGSRGDGLISSGGTRFNKSWDGIWYGRSRLTARGWQAEIALPFKTLAFRKGAATWGFNLRRLRKVNDEEDRWASPLLAYRFFRLSEGGRLTGLAGMRQGLGLDVTPYAKLSLKKDRFADDRSHRLGDFGLDLSYRITPELNLRLTGNTDFAETEVDARVNNLTRFPLFFPEKRAFFLEDQGLFQFGPSSRSGDDVLPFFSRTIGRDSAGSPVDLLAGAKLTGRVGNANIGFLHVLQDRHRDGSSDIGRKDLGVLRTNYKINKEHSVGLLGTWGRPNEQGGAWTGGVDFRFADSRFFGKGGDVSLGGYWLATGRNGATAAGDERDGDGQAYAVQATYDDRDFAHLLQVSAVDPDFEPELGFVRRTDVRTYRWRTRYTWRAADETSWIKRYEARITPRIVTNYAGNKDEWDVSLRWLELVFRSDDRFEYQTVRAFERLRQDFAIRPGITVPRGDYNTWLHEFTFATAERRPLSLFSFATIGDFLSGDLLTVSASPVWLVNRHLRLAMSYREDHVNLREGKFVDRITEARVDVNFTPQISLRSLMQYDTDSKELTSQTRFRWILRPGHELFLVGLYGWRKDDHTAPLVPTSQETTLKVLFTMRF